MNEMMEAILDNALEITPTVDKKGRVIKWTAGYMKYNPRMGGGSMVGNKDIARGETLSEAISNLFAGRTIWAVEIQPLYDAAIANWEDTGV